MIFITEKNVNEQARHRHPVTSSSGMYVIGVDAIYSYHYQWLVFDKKGY